MMWKDQHADATVTASCIIEPNTATIQSPSRWGDKRVKVAFNEAGVAMIDAPRWILLVDDDEWIRDVISRTLIRSQYRVTTASCAEEALKLLETTSFDLLISDVMMAGMNGLDLVSHVTQRYPHLPVVLITANGDTEMMRSALRAGAMDFIPKPFGIDTIPLVVERTLERSAINAANSEALNSQVRFDAVQALAKAIDAKEPYTAEHSRRVANIAVRLSEELGLKEQDQKLVELAALVHDVGKIGVPDFILSKPDRLSADEWAAVRLHPDKGAEIVGRIPQLNRVAEGVRYHHEWINGKGYPHALVGEEIPLISRIIAVADAYEVMTSDRVYRSRFSPEKASRLLHESAGQQFDAALVEVFLQMIATDFERDKD